MKLEYRTSVGLAFARTPALVDAEMPFVAAERTPPTLELLVAFHPPGLLVYGSPVPRETEVTTLWLTEGEVECRVSVNVS